MAYDLGTAKGTIELEYEGRRAVTEAEKDMDRVSKKSKDTDKSLIRLGNTLKNVFTGAKFTGLAIGLNAAAVSAANLVVELLGVVPQLTSIASLASALPGAFVAIGASIGVIKAITAGVGDTIKAAFDPKGADKFNEAIKQLAPAAQSFAKAIHSSADSLKAYQQGIQDAFFSTSGLTSAVPRVLGVLNKIRPSVLGLATDFGRLTKQVVGFATSSKTVGFVQDSLVSFRKALAVITPTITPVLEGLRAVGGVGLQLFPRLADSVAKVATTFANWLNSIAGSGQLQTWIDTALQTLSTLGTIAKNVGGILVSIFQAAGETSGGLLNNIATLTGAFNTFLKSAEGASAIRALFTGIGAAANALAPVLTTLVGALAGALGPALVRISGVLGPALLSLVQALTPAFAPLATAIADVVTAIAPLVPPLAQIISLFAQLAAGSLSAVAAELGPLIQLFSGSLMSALQELAPVIQQALVQGLPLAAQAGQALLEAFRPLAPVLVQFAQVLGQALVDNMPQLLAMAQSLIPVFTQLAQAISGNLVQSLTMLIPYIPQLVAAFIAFTNAILKVQEVIFTVDAFLINFGTTVASLPGKIGGALTAVKDWFVNSFNAVQSFLGTAIATIVNFFTGLPAKIGAALAALPGAIVGAIKNGANQAAFQFGAMIGTLITMAYRLPGQIGSALSSLGSSIVGVVRSAWNTARSAFSAGISAVVGFATTLPGRVRSAISGLISAIPGVARSAWNATRTAFSSGINNAVALARSLPGRIRSAVGNLVGLLAQAGRDAVAGFVNGIRSGVGAAADAARSLGSSVLSGIKSTLRIGSPSKEMITIGRFVTQGLEIGLKAGAKSLVSTSNKLANMVVDAFSNKLISKSAKSTALAVLKTGTAALSRLTAQATAVTAKLKTANDNLAAATKAYTDAYNNAVEKTKQTFSLVTSGQTFVNLDLTKERFAAAVQQAKDFAADIQKLAKRGLSKDLLQQLVDAGAADGGAMADALANASDATLKQFNTLQSQLNSAANSVGKTTADALYGAGLNAAKGLVAGLQKQQKSIQAQMDKIADAMVARIKKALKIKSPSRVMFSLGKFATQGLVDGLESLKRQVERAAQQLVSTSILPTVQLSANTAGTQSRQAIAGASVGGTSFTVNQTVNALPGMSAAQVAKFSLTKLRYGLSGGIVAASLPSPSPAGV
jgi:phage-related protein